MADDLIRKLLAEQRKRVVGSIMGGAEQSPWWSKLTPVDQRAYRQKVLDSIGVFYDFTLDVLKVNTDSVVNEHALDLIAEMHRDVRRLAAR